MNKFDGNYLKGGITIISNIGGISKDEINKILTNSKYGKIDVNTNGNHFNYVKISKKIISFNGQKGKLESESENE